jgi:hypothetical protein
VPEHHEQELRETMRREYARKVGFLPVLKEE